MSSIITASDLTTFTGKTLTPAIASQVVSAVNAYIERETGRCWGDTATVTETYQYKPTIWLRHPDVLSVSKIVSVYPGSTDYTLPTANYYFDSFGRLSLYAGPGWYPGSSNRFFRSTVKVTYSYGVDDVPEDLKLAALGIAAGFYNWAAGGQREVTATQVGSYRVEYAGNRRAQDVVDTAVSTNFSVIKSYKAPKV